jgi:hypothetical protein
LKRERVEEVDYRAKTDSDTVASLGHSLRVSAMGAAEEFIVVFHPMSDDATSTMEACRSEGLNRTFKAIERVGMALVDDVK